MNQTESKQASKTILMVEDNPTMRKLTRAALETEGYRVEEAADGKSALEFARDHKPDLILQDLMLPDMDGFQLIERLRALEGYAHLPILAVSGFLTRLDENSAAHMGFNELLIKPVTPSFLIEKVGSYLSLDQKPHELLGHGRRILVADDNPAQLKLNSLKLSMLGFAVETAGDGKEALEKAKRNPPDAILSDILMPDMDGFELCLAIRQNPLLKAIPVVLTSSHYTAEADQKLAKKLGASALLKRMEDFEVVAMTLLDSTQKPVNPMVGEILGTFKEDHYQRITEQLQQQLKMNTELFQTNSQLSHQLSLMGSLNEALSKGKNTESLLEDILKDCLVSADISHWALFERNREGKLGLKCQNGYGSAEIQSVEGFFGFEKLFEKILTDEKIGTLPSDLLSMEDTQKFFEQAKVGSSALIPLSWGGESYGLLYLGAGQIRLEGKLAQSFAFSLGQKMSQAIALSRTIEHLTQSELQNQTLIENANDAIFLLNEKWEIMRGNRQAEKLLGCPKSQMEGRGCLDFVLPEDKDHAISDLKKISDGQSSVTQPIRLVQGNGKLVYAQFSAVPLDLDGQKVVMSIGRDVTEQMKAEQGLIRLAAIVESSPDAIYGTDLDGIINVWNPSAERLYGYGPTEIIGRHLTVISPAENHFRMFEMLEACKKGQLIFPFETIHKNRNQQRMNVALTFSPLKDRNGEVKGVSIITRDITEHKRLEELFREREEMVHALIAEVPKEKFEKIQLGLNQALENGEFHERF